MRAITKKVQPTAVFLRIEKYAVNAKNVSAPTIVSAAKKAHKIPSDVLKAMTMGVSYYNRLYVEPKEGRW